MLFLGLSVIQLFSKWREELGAFFLFYLNGISVYLKQSKTKSMGDGRRIRVPPDLHCLRLNMHVCYQKRAQLIKIPFPLSG